MLRVYQGNSYQIELNKVNGSFGFNVMVSVKYILMFPQDWCWGYVQAGVVSERFQNVFISFIVLTPCLHGPRKIFSMYWISSNFCSKLLVFASVFAWKHKWKRSKTFPCARSLTWAVVLVQGGAEEGGIFLKSITPNGPASKSGKMLVGEWLLHSNHSMDDSSYRLNFNPGKKNKIQYHS